MHFQPESLGFLQDSDELVTTTTSSGGFMKKYQKPVVVKLGSVLLIKGNKNVKSDMTTVGFL